MTSADLVSPAQGFDDLAVHPEALFRTPNQNNAVPAANTQPAFILSDGVFTQLQLYIETGLQLPDMESFGSTYSLEQFSTWLSPDEYAKLRETLVAINAHCENFNENGIGRIVELSNAITELAKMATRNIQALQHDFSIICDPNIPLATAQSNKDSAQEKLAEMEAGCDTVIGKCDRISASIRAFISSTQTDKIKVDAVAKIMSEKMPASKLKQAVRDQMSATHETMLKKVHDMEKSYNGIETATQAKYYVDIPSYGKVAWLQSFLMDWNTLQGALKDYMDAVTECDKKKVQLLKLADDMDNLHRGLANIDCNMASIMATLNSIQGCMDGVKTTIKKKLEGLRNEIMSEAPGDAETVQEKAQAAQEAWEQLYQVAKTFKDHGLIRKPNATTTKPFSPIMAVHHGALDMTHVATNFYDGKSITFNTGSLAWPDPWKGNPKSLSVVYRFKPHAPPRVFVCSTEKPESYKLTEGENIGRGTKSFLASRSFPATTKPWTIHAILYGLQEITDDKILRIIEGKAQNKEAVMLDSKTFKTQGHDSWPGVAKSVLIVYSHKGELGYLAGREGQEIRFPN